MSAPIKSVLRRVHEILPQPVRRAASPFEPLFYRLVSSDGRQTAELPWGVQMKLDFDRQPEFQRSNGTYEPEVVNEIQARFAGESHHIADIGANIGYYSLLFDSIMDGGRVDAFEPFPPILRRFRENLDLNEPTDITVNELAVGDSTGPQVLTRPNDGNVAMATTVNVEGEENTVQEKALDDIYSEDTVPDVLKIDIEGGEIDLVRGGEQTLALADIVILEVHGWRLSSAEMGEIVGALEDAGFSSLQFLSSGREVSLSDDQVKEQLEDNIVVWVE